MNALEKLIKEKIDTGYGGSWSPVYFEPIAKSGERITVAIVAQGADSEYHIHRAASHKVLKCMYGIEVSPGIDQMIQMTMKAINIQLEAGREIHECVLPLTGMSFGKIKKTVAPNLEGIIKIGIQSASSLSSMDVTLEKGDDIKESMETWRTMVKSSVLSINSTLEDCFKKKLKLSGSQKGTPFDFVKDGYVCNFATIPPSNLGSNTGFKSKVFDLESVQRVTENDGNIYRLDMVIGIPYAEDSTGLGVKARSKLIENMNFMRQQAEDRQIGCFISHNAEDAAQYIVQRAG